MHEVPSTGHEWDGITEYDNPMPRWWLWTFYACIVWAIGYMLAYPALPLVSSATQGMLGTNYRKEVASEIARVDAANAPIEDQITQVALDEIPANEELFNFAKNAGGAVFRTWCAQCHGSGAGGNRGYPNLLDNDWLWSGTLDEIHLTIQHGIRDPQDPDTRYSEMPRFGTDELLDDEQIGQVVDYVLAMAKQPHDAAAAASAAPEGKVVYDDNCASCHAEDGTGDHAQGAPNLTDAVWLFVANNAPDVASVTKIVHDGPFGVMPSWTGRLSEAEMREVAVYVHGLGGGE
ncbi:cytochrome-c oxidase, cbb3-type subunit III [Paracoccus sp. (in: a-proteobacteria)]|uniref:cytochrome-c oxidase, cbb3-type subunit III n=1 Tax=Paracoccus sp. TaxID=267 RepID=UPI003A8A8819